MKNSIYILFFLFSIFTNAQTALYNSGNLQIHQNGQIGFHTNLINNGIFDNNLGLAGFYGNDMVSVSGAFIPIFHDTEIANPKGVLLDISIANTNNMNFILGDIISTRTQRNIYFNFLKDAFYVGESNTSKVDGSIQINNKQTFTFPVGDSQQLRPLILNSEATNIISKCTYFFDNPNNTYDFKTPFSTNVKPEKIKKTSSLEFWTLEGSIPSRVTISWNERSDIASLTNDVNTIIIVGWNKAKKRWLSLGNITLSGNLTQGFATSESFIPDAYEIITFGTIAVPKKLLKLENYLVTPNGDGTNEVLIIPELEQSPNNTLRIFDRYGLKVFEMDNYTSQFNGFTNTKNIIFGKKKALPSNIYFYTVSMYDLGLDFQGFLYLTQ